jgi:hypothetical protein
MSYAELAGVVTQEPRATDQHRAGREEDGDGRPLDLLQHEEVQQDEMGDAEQAGYGYAVEGCRWM